MLYMIIEKFYPEKIKAVYERFEKKGRLMPEGLSYLNSWIDADLTTCYQVMETSDEQKIHEWISNWNDLANFEVIPVLTSRQAKIKVFET
jgi:hypothetical protein